MNSAISPINLPAELRQLIVNYIFDKKRLEEDEDYIVDYDALFELQEVDAIWDDLIDDVLDCLPIIRDEYDIFQNKNGALASDTCNQGRCLSAESDENL